MASRSVKCTLANKSKFKLTVTSVELKAGEWSPGSELSRGTVIAAGEEKTWKSVGDKIANGSAQLDVEDGSSLIVIWHNPDEGPSKYYQEHIVAGDKGTQYEEGTVSAVEGGDATVMFPFEPKLAQSVPPPPPSQGTTNAQATCGQTAHVSPPAGSKDVMLIPEKKSIPAGSFQAALLNDNWQWAQQWMKADPDHRTTIEVRVDGTLKDFEDAAKKAAAIAKGRSVILFTGHGAAPDEADANESSNAKAKFDTVPESTGLSAHKYTIGFDLLVELPAMADVKEDGTFKRREGRYESETTIAAYDIPKYATLLRIGRAFRENCVYEFVGLTCRVANDKEFTLGLARALGVQVVTYGDYVVTGEDSGQVQIWTTKNKADKDKVRPKTQGDNGHSSYHDLPVSSRKTASPP